MKDISIGQGKNYWGKDVFSLLSWFDAEKVANARVMVVGAGALGNEVLKNLALFGIGNIFIVDFDTIEQSNLCRSVLFRPEDSENKSMKAEVAARRIKEINPGINVGYIAGDIGTDVGLGIIRRMDVVIGCLDNRLARYLINRQCFRANKTWVDGGIENLEGNVRIFMPGVNCYECSLSDFELEQLFYRTGCPDIANINFTEGRIATTPISSSIIGAIQTQEALKIIHGYDENSAVVKCKTLNGRIFKYDGMFLSFQNMKFSNYEEDCLSHELWEPIVHIKELQADISIYHTLNILKKKLGVDEVSINLMNNRLIYQLVLESTEEEFDVLLPESQVADYIDFHNLKKDPREKIFQRYYENIGEEFPFLDFSLKEIGIPELDVIQVTSENNVFWVELTGDEEKFNFH